MKAFLLFAFSKEVPHHIRLLVMRASGEGMCGMPILELLRNRIHKRFWCGLMLGLLTNDLPSSLPIHGGRHSVDVFAQRGMHLDYAITNTE